MTDILSPIDDEDPFMGILADSVMYGLEKKKSLSIQPPVKPPVYKFILYYRYLQSMKIYRALRVKELQENKEVQNILSTLDSNRDLVQPLLEGNKLSSRLKNYIGYIFKK